DEFELRRLLSGASKPTFKAQKRGTPSAQPWFCPAVWFAAYTGSRRGETLALCWSDIDLEAKEVTIRRSLSQTRNELIFKSTKSGKTRIVSMPHKLVTALREYQVAQTFVRKQMGEAYKDQELVFALADGSPVQPWTFTAAFRNLVKRAGVKRIRLHDLRHTHISLLIGKAGVSLKMASSRAGHSTVSFTADRYSHVYRSEDAKAAKKFEPLVG
ncbi:MAG TPA: site-specific integrase, partial [Candidatus Rubrimentiphilum sp.]|nr:site-specific integrase [Candidatus Rubrimentiphilum sp.]